MSLTLTVLVTLATGLHGDGAATLPSIKGAITADSVREDIAFLSSDDMGGRFFRSPFAEKAAVWITAQFEKIPLAKGASGDSFRQAVDSNEQTAPNLIGVLPGTAPGYIIVSAHYDHLRPKRSGTDKIYNGADDNASGVAGALAVARAMKACAAAGNGPKCSVIFIAFNGEEAGLLGSRAFVKSPTIPLGEIRAVFNMDMISRGAPREIFIDGGKIGEPVIAALRKANEQIGLKLRIDEHPDWLDRSDQGPFLKKQVPAVLFSVEDHEDYHQVSDEVAKIDAGLAAEVAQLVSLAAIQMSDAPFEPRAAPVAPVAPVVPAAPAVPATPAPPAPAKAPTAP